MPSDLPSGTTLSDIDASYAEADEPDLHETLEMLLEWYDRAIDQFIDSDCSDPACMKHEGTREEWLAGAHPARYAIAQARGVSA